MGTTSSAGSLGTSASVAWEHGCCHDLDPEVSVMIEVLDGMPEGVVGVEAVGELTADDYEKVLIPTFEAGRAAHDHLNVVFVVGERFTGFTSGAMWDDLKWGT